MSAAGLRRPAEGDHLPLHRRTAETLRERRRADRRAAQAAGGSVNGPAALAEGCPPRLHRHPVAVARRGGQGGGAGRGDRARRPVGAHHRAGARRAQSAAGGRQGRRPEADGDQAAAREGRLRSPCSRSASSGGWWPGADGGQRRRRRGHVQPPVVEREGRRFGGGQRRDLVEEARRAAPRAAAPGAGGRSPWSQTRGSPSRWPGWSGRRRLRWPRPRTPRRAAARR